MHVTGKDLVDAVRETIQVCIRVDQPHACMLQFNLMFQGFHGYFPEKRLLVGIKCYKGVSRAHAQTSSCIACCMQKKKGVVGLDL